MKNSLKAPWLIVTPKARPCLKKYVAEMILTSRRGAAFPCTSLIYLKLETTLLLLPSDLLRCDLRNGAMAVVRAKDFPAARKALENWLDDFDAGRQ